MENKCNKCNRNFSSDKSLKQHNLVKHAGEKKEKVNSRKYLVSGLIVLIVLFSTLTINSYMKKPGEFDSFAKCLTDKGVVVYGNDFCPYTPTQLNLFGKSKAHLNYVKCIDNEAVCDKKEIKITPTWEIKGKIYEGVQGFDKLALLSGCDL